VRFGGWQPLAAAIAPPGPGIFQARFGQGAAGLRPLPRGQSAMALYGADDEDLPAALARLRDGLTTDDVEELWVRFAAPEPGRKPSESAARLRADFVRRFGAPPPLERP
jgi:hypothetical protein